MKKEGYLPLLGSRDCRDFATQIAIPKIAKWTSRSTYSSLGVAPGRSEQLIRTGIVDLWGVYQSMLGSTDPPARANGTSRSEWGRTWVGGTMPLCERSQCNLKLSVSILGLLKCSHQVSASGMAWYSRSGEGPGACACARSS